MVAKPERRLHDTLPMPGRERHRQLVEWNNVPGPHLTPDYVTRFTEQVERTPESPAVVCRERSWTYRELHQLMSKTADALAEAGVGPTRSSLCLENGAPNCWR